MIQTDIFDALREGAIARRTDPDTSHEAARTVDSLRAKQRYVLATLRHYGPATFDDLIADYRAHGFPRQSDSGIRTRVSELREAGFVEDTGERRTLPSGRRAIVWRVVPR